MIKLLDESIEMHDELNPKLWKDGRLLPEVREKIIEIVAEFKAYLDELPLDIIDIHILGSNAGFNYTDKSDLDIHVIVNFDTIDASDEILQALYNSKRTSFNNAYNITIKNIPAELYVEDVKSNTLSNGIYSLNENAWTKYPEKIEVPELNIDAELVEYRDKIYKAIASENLEVIKTTLNNMYLIRKNGLAINGEYSIGNQLFKQLRNEGLIDKLRDAMYSIASTELSLEKLRKDGII